MPLFQRAQRADPPPGYCSCMSTCEACLTACDACMSVSQGNGTVLFDATSCIEACKQVLHALSSGAATVPEACANCARCCEGLARECMLLPAAEYRRCAQACYRAARECHKVAHAGRRMPWQGGDARSRGSHGARRQKRGGA